MAEKLTKEVVETAGAGTVWDGGEPGTVKGFGLRVLPSGTRTFFLNYRIAGRERRHKIGQYPLWSVSAARLKAAELRKGVDHGEDPAAKKRADRDAPTVQDLIDRYVSEHLPTKTAGQHSDKIARQRVNDEKKMLAEIGARLGKHTKIADIHGGDIEKMHRDISESIGRGGRPRAVRANRILSIASKAFALALKVSAGENKAWRDQAQGNPCKGVERNDEEGRERFYSKAELERIAEALLEYPGLGADCIRLVMVTGCRPDEARLARWEQFDKEPEVWCKPSAHTKQRKIHRIPLNPPALQLIERLRAKRQGPWLFPGQSGDEPVAVLRHVWDFVRERANLAKDEHGNEARIYDLRHTFASVGAGNGLGLPIIGKLLGHTQARTTQKYAHLADDPLRDATNKIGAIIERGDRPTAEIVSFKG